VKDLIKLPKKKDKVLRTKALNNYYTNENQKSSEYNHVYNIENSREKIQEQENDDHYINKNLGSL
jgi:hypothetical protein